MFSHSFRPIACVPSYLARVDPRARIVAGLFLVLVVSLAKNMAAIAMATAISAGLVAMARLSPRDLFRRLLPVEILVATVAVFVPFPEYHRDGLRLALVIALKANAVVLAIAALIGTMDAVTLGHALAHLRTPQKLTRLMLFMVRYFELLGLETARLRAAMRVRCFRPAMNGHTYRTIGYLVGMMLVRSFDRSERVLAAMKCRGFRGQYYLLDHFAFVPRRDVPFCAAAVLVTAAMIGLEWL
jgi:cobalt/nickel transport system permease protein